MVRKHGWQLPAHTFQVVAITVFCLVVVAFYAFFAPFLGGRIWKCILIGVYSPVALLVFILYVRSTAIDAADPGIMSKFDPKYMNEAREKRESIAHNLSRKFDKGSVELVKTNAQTQVVSPRRRSFCHYFGGFLCAIFVLEDCRKQDEAAEQEGTGEDALFCMLCNAEVWKFSKHCRSCDKCVDGFDHLCLVHPLVWLHNWVGRKNYMTFISLMGIRLVWLVVESGVGIGVLVRCFTNKLHMEAEIVDRLGNSFSRASFADCCGNMYSSVLAGKCTFGGTFLFPRDSN